jgi:regulator of protease activity HflC (stomatin/prohibitin superfamily)
MCEKSKNLYPVFGEHSAGILRYRRLARRYGHLSCLVALLVLPVTGSWAADADVQALQAELKALKAKISELEAVKAKLKDVEDKLSAVQKAQAEAARQAPPEGEKALVKAQAAPEKPAPQ